jgi:guanylate kinase
MKGNVIIVSAPSGAGKTSLVRELLEHDPATRKSVSYTTRPRRRGEQDGIDYHFVSADKFQAMLEAGEFLESAEVHGNMYGTGQKWLEEQRLQGRDVVLEIDWQGAKHAPRIATTSLPGACPRHAMRYPMCTSLTMLLSMTFSTQQCKT